MSTHRDTDHVNHPWPRLGDFYLHLPFGVTFASQEHHGLSCATVDITSPPWAQTPVALPLHLSCALSYLPSSVSCGVEELGRLNYTGSWHGTQTSSQ